MEKSPVVMAEEGEHSGAKELPKPKISMSDLTFVIGVYTTKSKKLTLVEFGADREFNPNDRFKIEIVDLSRFELPKSGMDDVMITWEVVYKKDWQNIVTIVKGRRSFRHKLTMVVQRSSCSRRSNQTWPNRRCQGEFKRRLT